MTKAGIGLTARTFEMLNGLAGNNNCDESDGVHAAVNDADIQIEHGNAVETMPRGLADHADHRQVHTIGLKGLYAVRLIPKSGWIDDSIEADRD
ncbi:MAG: hypothetical protein ACJAR2_002008 [Ilumatobacter sp.]|jgi:hypothetical protein